MSKKEKYKNIIPISTTVTFVTCPIFLRILGLELDRYEWSLFYMLLFLCITEIIKSGD